VVNPSQTEMGEAAPASERLMFQLPFLHQKRAAGDQVAPIQTTFLLVN